MLIKDVVKEKGNEVFTVKDDTLVVGAAEVMMDRNIGIVVVCTDERQVLGVLSERDIIRAVVEWPEQVSSMKVSQIYTENPISCSPDDEIISVLNEMKERRFRHMPVIQHGKLAGLVSTVDLFVAHFGEIELGEEASAWSYLEFL